jgi:hypothetical protein
MAPLKVSSKVSGKKSSKCKKDELTSSSEDERPPTLRPRRNHQKPARYVQESDEDAGKTATDTEDTQSVIDVDAPEQSVIDVSVSDVHENTELQHSLFIFRTMRVHVRRHQPSRS